MNPSIWAQAYAYVKFLNFVPLFMSFDHFLFEFDVLSVTNVCMHIYGHLLT